MMTEPIVELDTFKARVHGFRTIDAPERIGVRTRILQCTIRTATQASCELPDAMNVWFAEIWFVRRPLGTPTADQPRVTNQVLSRVIGRGAEVR